MEDVASLPSLTVPLLDKLVPLGPPIALDVIYPIFLLLVVPAFAGSWPVLSANGPFYSKLCKLSLALAGDLQAECEVIVRPELSRQHSRTEHVNSVSLNNRKLPNCNGRSLSRGDTLPSSDSSELSPKFYTSHSTSPGNCNHNHGNSQMPGVYIGRKDCNPMVTEDNQTGSKQENTADSSGSSSTVRGGTLDSGEFHLTSDVTAGRKDSPTFLAHNVISGVGSLAGESGASTCTVQSGANYNARPYRKGAPPNKQAGGHEVQPGVEGAVKKTSHESKYPVQESGLPHSSDIVVTVPVVPRRIGLVLGSDFVSWKHKLMSDSGNSKVSSSPKSPRATEGASTTNPTVTAVGQTGPQKWTKPSKADQTGCIVYSSIAAFAEGTFLPLPSREAVERNIGKGGNGTISIVYFKGVEFAVKRTHYRQMEVEILSSLCHDNVLPLQAVMMGEEDPQRPSRHLCYHFMPRMSGDLQGYLTKVGHGALSNLLMQHREDPTMLQLVVDNTKHILRSTLKALAYLHSIHIVHNDVKPSNFLTNTQCGCQSPLLCNHGQRFAVKLSDYDSALDVAKVQTRHSVLRQLYRNNPIGTPGYRPPEYVLVATRTPDELDAGTLTAADVWGFGCSVLKIFLSHSGPHTQKQMSFLHLWHKGGYPWEVEGERAREELKLGLLERVYPNWPQLWAFVSECLKVSPKDRMTCSKLIEHPFFVS